MGLFTAGCPEVINVTLTENVRNDWSELGQIYKRMGSCGGHPYWEDAFGRAIWLDTHIYSNWIIGYLDELGTDNAVFIENTDKSSECPTEENLEWYYYHRNNHSDWQPAGKKINVESYEV